MATRLLGERWGLDAGLETALGRLLSNLQSALGDDLVAVMLVGFDRTLPFDPEIQDLELLFVLERVAAPQLRAMVEPLMSARQELPIDPIVYSSDDLLHSLDVFPLQIAEIKSQYDVLLGPDVLAPVKLLRADTRLALEREVKTVLLRLHHLFLLRSGIRPAWQETMQDTIAQVLRVIGHSLLLSGHRRPVTVAEQLEAAEQQFGLEAAVLNRVYELRVGESLEASELEILFELYLANVHRLASWIDHFSVNLPATGS